MSISSEESDFSASGLSISPHDPFGAGHSSTSVSAALGFAQADRLEGSDQYTIAVLGDGAYTGGMVQAEISSEESDFIASGLSIKGKILYSIIKNTK